MHRRATFHGDADHPRVRLHGLHGQRHAGDEPTARERHHHGLDHRQVFDDLQAERALPGDDPRIVEGRQHDHSFLGDKTVDLGLGFVLGTADDANLGAQGLDALHLVAWHQ